MFRGSKAAMAAVFLLVTVGVVSTAHADLATLYFGAKGETFGGTGDVYQGFDNRFGGGVEVGLELLGIDLFAEAVSLGTDQYLFSTNLGFDIGFGDDVRFQVGVFTGPIFFLFPESDSTGVDFSGSITDADLEGTDLTVAELEEKFNEQLQAEKDLSRLAIGWNVARLKADVDFRLAPAIYLGLGGSFGYHFLLTGEAVASGAKNQALEQYQKDNPDYPDELFDKMRDAIGAKPVDKANLDGTNFEVNLHLRFEIGG